MSESQEQLKKKLEQQLKGIYAEKFALEQRLKRAHDNIALENALLAEEDTHEVTADELQRMKNLEEETDRRYEQVDARAKSFMADIQAVFVRQDQQDEEVREAATQQDLLRNAASELVSDIQDMTQEMLALKKEKADFQQAMRAEQAAEKSKRKADKKLLLQREQQLIAKQKEAIEGRIRVNAVLTDLRSKMAVLDAEQAALDQEINVRDEENHVLLKNLLAMELSVAKTEAKLKNAQNRLVVGVPSTCFHREADCHLVLEEMLSSVCDDADKTVLYNLYRQVAAAGQKVAEREIEAAKVGNKRKELAAELEQVEREKVATLEELSRLKNVATTYRDVFITKEQFNVKLAAELEQTEFDLNAATCSIKNKLKHVVSTKETLGNVQNLKNSMEELMKVRQHRQEAVLLATDRVQAEMKSVSEELQEARSDSTKTNGITARLYLQQTVSAEKAQNAHSERVQKLQGLRMKLDAVTSRKSAMQLELAQAKQKAAKVTLKLSKVSAELEEREGACNTIQDSIDNTHNQSDQITSAASQLLLEAIKDCKEAKQEESDRLRKIVDKKRVQLAKIKLVVSEKAATVDALEEDAEEMRRQIQQLQIRRDKKKEDREFKKPAAIPGRRNH